MSNPRGPDGRMFWASKIFALLMLLILVPVPSRAATSSNHTVTLIVPSIREISVSGSFMTITMGQPTAGSLPGAVVDNSAKYSFTTNVSSENCKVNVKVPDGTMPNGVTLKMDLAAPPVGNVTSITWENGVNANNVYYALVSGITPQACPNLGITLTLNPKGPTPPPAMWVEVTFTFALFPESW